MGRGAGSWEHQYTVFDRHGPRCAHMPPRPTLPCWYISRTYSTLTLGHCCNTLPHRQGKCCPVPVTLAKGSNFTKYAHRKTPGSNLCYKVFTSAPRLVQRAAQEVAIVSLPSTQDKPPKKISFVFESFRVKKWNIRNKTQFQHFFACKISFVPLDNWAIGKPRIPRQFSTCP